MPPNEPEHILAAIHALDQPDPNAGEPIDLIIEFVSGKRDSLPDWLYRILQEEGIAIVGLDMERNRRVSTAPGLDVMA